MQITYNTLDTTKGPTDWFTGDVYVDAAAAPVTPSRASAGIVHFTPSARTHWHTHPLGQTIYVTEGVGRCQTEGRPVETLHPGDRVYFAPAENHWHGAAPDRFMVHIAITETDETGSNSTFTDPVTDEQYNAGA
jgi:quercetin dioxygenase-like cupin family protein